MIRIRYKYISDVYKPIVYVVYALIVTFIWYIVVFYFVIPYLAPHDFYERFLTVVLALVLLYLLCHIDDKVREVTIYDE